MSDRRNPVWPYWTDWYEEEEPIDNDSTLWMVWLAQQGKVTHVSASWIMYTAHGAMQSLFSCISFTDRNSRDKTLELNKHIFESKGTMKILSMSVPSQHPSHKIEEISIRTTIMPAVSLHYFGAWILHDHPGRMPGFKWLNTKRVSKIKRQSFLLYFPVQSVNLEYFAITQLSFNLQEEQKRYLSVQVTIILILLMSISGKNVRN